MAISAATFRNYTGASNVTAGKQETSSPNKYTGKEEVFQITMICVCMSARGGGVGSTSTERHSSRVSPLAFLPIVSQGFSQPR